MERRRRRRKRGVFWSICLAFHFLLFFIELLSPAATSFLLRSEQKRLRRLMGKWKTGGGGVGWNRPNCHPSAEGASVHHMLPDPGPARTKLLQEGRKALRDNLDPMLGLGLAKNIYGPNPSLFQS